MAWGLVIAAVFVLQRDVVQPCRVEVRRQVPFDVSMTSLLPEDVVDTESDLLPVDGQHSCRKTLSGFYDMSVGERQFGARMADDRGSDQKTTNKKWPMRSQMVTWLMTARHLKGQSRDPIRLQQISRKQLEMLFSNNRWFY